MTPAELEASLEGLSDEELKAKLADMESGLQKQLGKASQQFNQTLKLSEERLNYAAGELARVAQLRRELEPHKNHPEGARHFQAMELLCRMYYGMKRMMEFQYFANEHNVAMLKSETLMERPVFRVPDDHPGYWEARCEMDLAMASFYWIELGDGIDMVLRAALGEVGLAPGTAEEQQAREGRAAALKAAMAESRELGMAVAQMATELQELKALMAWGTETLASVAKLPDVAKMRPVTDPEWAKLNGKLAFLAGLGQKAQGFPALAPHFPATSAVKLPYPEIAVMGTGPLPAGGTGRLRGQTGRLQTDKP
jgi:hypothetical protein